ncbi:MAG TPA: hypothetical protein VHO70_03945, partial [Chitinispirillaceae bacterium]|nr:hypothetical protein [Chitinispirillaceae bacterium]
LHNAHNSSKTKCYLRHGNNYVEWFVKNDIGDTSGPSFPNYRSPDNQKVIQNSPSVVFYNPESKKVNDSIELGKNMNRLLCQNIKKMFPDTMADEIVKLCFGSNQ